MLDPPAWFLCSVMTTDRRAVRAASAVGDASATPSLSPLQCARSLDFWLLFLVFGIGAGCGILFINNVGEGFDLAAREQGFRAEALDCDPHRLCHKPHACIHAALPASPCALGHIHCRLTCELTTNSGPCR